MAAKKTIFFILIFLFGIGNFAYASSPMVVCVDMPVMDMSHACYGPKACECRMEAGRPEVLFDQIFSQQGASLESLVTDRINAKSFEIEPSPSDFIFSALKSPPKDKVYDLYSQYRI